MARRKIPVGPLVVFVQLLLLAVIGGSVSIAGYLAAKRLLSDTVQQNFERASIVAEQVLFEELDRLSTSVELFAADDELQLLVLVKRWGMAGDIIYDRFIDLSGESVDVLLLTDAEGNLKANAGNLIDDTYEIVAEMRPNLSSHAWHVVGDRQKYILKSTPIIDPRYGEVIGYLLNGVGLYGNIKVAQSLKRLTGMDTLAIYVDEIPQVAVPAGSDQVHLTNGLHPNTIPSNGMVQFDDTKLAYVADIRYVNRPFVQLLLTVNAKAFSGLTAAFETSLLYILGLIVLGSLLALFVLQKAVIIPARQLSEYAQGLLSDEMDAAAKNKEVSTPIKEFQDAAHVVQYVFNELQETNANLEGIVADRTRALKVEESKTRQIVDSAKDGIITINDTGRILTFNLAAQELFSYSPQEIIGQSACTLFAEYTRGTSCSFEKGAISGIEPLGDQSAREYFGRKQSGANFMMEISISEFVNIEHDTVYVWIIRDITDRKEAEIKLRLTLEKLQTAQNELVESEKMASLGALVAGVAHEINTPVGVGLTAATHLHEKTKLLNKLFGDGAMKKTDLVTYLDTADKSADIIERNLNRASELVRSFKQVAVDQTSDEVRSINLLGYIREILQSLHPKLKRTSHVIHVDGDEELVIETHPGALSQIITNLLLNSLLHAFDEDEGGSIIIQVHRSKDDVHLTYSDNGKGMEEDIKTRIFEPFYTTKRGGGGSGLGMHIVYNQVSQTLNGTIELTSAPGEGSTFHIRFPVSSVPKDKNKNEA